METSKSSRSSSLHSAFPNSKSSSRVLTSRRYFVFAMGLYNKGMPLCFLSQKERWLGEVNAQRGDRGIRRNLGEGENLWSIRI